MLFNFAVERCISSFELINLVLNAVSGSWMCKESGYIKARNTHDFTLIDSPKESHFKLYYRALPTWSAGYEKYSSLQISQKSNDVIS